MISGINYFYLQVAGICGAGQQHGWVDYILSKGHILRSYFWISGLFFGGGESMTSSKGSSLKGGYFASFTAIVFISFDE